MFFECRRWKRSANSESNKLDHLHPGKNASISRDFLCYSSSIDKTVRSLSETKQPSSWHSSGSTAGRHRRFQALCTEGKEPGLPGHLTLSGNFYLHVTSSLWAPYLWYILITTWNVSMALLSVKKSIVPRNKNMIPFLLLEQRKGKTLSLNEVPRWTQGQGLAQFIHPGGTSHLC